MVGTWQEYFFHFCQLPPVKEHNKGFHVSAKSLRLFKVTYEYLTNNWFLGEKELFLEVFSEPYVNLHNDDELLNFFFLRYWRRFKIYVQIDFLTVYHPLVYLLKTQTLTQKCNASNGNASNALFHLYQVHLKWNCSFYCPNLHFIANNIQHIKSFANWTSSLRKQVKQNTNNFWHVLFA